MEMHAHMDVSGERVGGEDAGAGAIGEVERGDGIDGLGRRCSSSSSCSLGGGGGGRGDGCLGSPLGCGGGLLLAGVGDHDDPWLEQLGGSGGGGRRKNGREESGRVARRGKKKLARALADEKAENSATQTST